jgi:thioredoxin 1
MVLQISSKDFEKEVLKSGTPVLVDLYADWCPPCKKLAPELDKLAAAMGSRLKIVKINVDTLTEGDAVGQVMAERGIRSIPTLLLYKNGQVIAQQTGAAPAAKLAQWVDSKIGNSGIPPNLKP